MAARVAEIIDVQTLAGQQVLNVLHFVDPAGTGDLPTLVDNYVTSVIPLMKVFQTPSLSHVAIRYREVSPTASLILESTTGLPIVGTATGTVDLASCDALSAKWTLGATVVIEGGFTGHLKRGGIRTAGSGEEHVDGNTCTSGTITSFAAFVSELLNPGTDVFQLCVASFLNGARARQTTVQAYSIVSGASAPSPSTQNTRKVLRGRTS